ncbi:MAG TPA: ATP-binding cassette domain-containing protein [Polyangiaceae bacterium LLY-WYZ-15_(1-7)]|nr:ATP-binding cassette domain-containing protein [Polyangiaceae bacterium LLY-WYZ-15_(1-7)]HJL07709.1 ATP-binding cassette domain-containing protein [Polyangiaceae bacterium LLY-WYZ-15_(1-7)]HJL37613.1 ATP-binding cassette domain-containing protein [Polyangiaceae bacterium LLY-WYZ-15_(1-7)]HJL44434.1 ATP-binding cassette domain-containing protein [Polyangiaceae bacterium LLY-WYZ-15_(1-7)]
MAWSAAIRAELGAFMLDVELEGDARPLALVGPNGSGKTTLLRALAGAVRPRAGTIRVGDALLFDEERGVDVPMERRRVGYVPQGYGLFPHLDALGNVAFGLRLGRRERERRARAMLEELGCGGLARRPVGRLSGGERQRVALARALVLEPGLLLLDEPLAALDAIHRRAVRRLLAERLRAYGRPAILTTHDARDIAALGARVAVLEGGRVVQEGELEALRAAPANEFVAELVGA